MWKKNHIIITKASRNFPAMTSSTCKKNDGEMRAPRLFNCEESIR